MLAVLRLEHFGHAGSRGATVSCRRAGASENAPPTPRVPKNVIPRWSEPPAHVNLGLFLKKKTKHFRPISLLGKQIIYCPFFCFSFKN